LPIRSHRAARIARKKILVVGVAAAVLIVGFWFYWSPRASVSGNLSLRDLVAIRWAVRTQTLQPILIIYQGATGTVKVLTGVQRAPLDGSGYFYELKKTTNGWKITESGGWVS
jgi:hypothetical protein